MEVDEFVNLSVNEVRRFVQKFGQMVCVFPINGTRRWFLLEHPPETWGEKTFLEAYHEHSVRRQLEIYRLFFDHGIETLIMPLFGPDLLERGEEYVEVMAAALQELACGQVFLDFYRKHDVRVHFYGDHRRYLRNTPYEGLSDLFDEVAEATRHHSRYRLFYGVFGHDATERVAELAVEYHQKQGCLPDKRKIIELYYGEFVPPVSLFIGFDRFSSFDMPLVATGEEDLYFTASPSFYINENLLRRILYDHLISRRTLEQDYESLSPAAVQRLDDFYRMNRDRVFGVGQVHDGFWYPTTEIYIPDSFTSELRRTG